MSGPDSMVTLTAQFFGFRLANVPHHEPRMNVDSLRTYPRERRILVTRSITTFARSEHATLCSSFTCSPLRLANVPALTCGRYAARGTSARVRRSEGRDPKGNPPEGSHDAVAPVRFSALLASALCAARQQSCSRENTLDRFHRIVPICARARGIVEVRLG